jgi:hypothetical protein
VAVPRRRAACTVIAKEEEPVWIAPVALRQVARENGLKLAPMTPGRPRSVTAACSMSAKNRLASWTR